MAKWAHSDILDAELGYITGNATRILVCNAQPANFVEANATYALANNTCNAANFGALTANGLARYTQLNQFANISVSANGTASHVALVNVGGSKLLTVTTCTNQALTIGNTVTIPAHNYQSNQPA
jgi:hypothetical protein